MKALEDKICAEGEVLPGIILKVGSFLNHQVDVDFVMEMGREIAKLFADGGVTKILTIETSGIAVAMAAAAALHVPMVFAKKHRTGNLSGEFYTAVVHSTPTARTTTSSSAATTSARRTGSCSWTTSWPTAARWRG